MKLFDRQKKQEINLYAYYDHAGIVRHLEDMARQGWQLEKAGSVFWTYRRCKPAELRYAVVYFSKASQFDPEPPAEQREFWELCKATGWELVTNRYQMQIFRNPAPDAIPIETDPVVQVENVRAAMKKGSVRGDWWLLASFPASALAAIPLCLHHPGSAAKHFYPVGYSHLADAGHQGRRGADRLLPLVPKGPDRRRGRRRSALAPDP